MEITNEELDDEGEEDEMPITTMSNIDWIGRKKIYLKKLKEHSKVENCDRLEILKRIIDVHCLLKESVTGWDDWFIPHVMTLMTEKEIKDFFSDYASVTKKYVEMDIKMTELVESKRDKMENHICFHKDSKPQYAV